ncbi:MAG TPA: flagellar hook-basal body complex protein [Candidimonas sp.]|nr:flagellar hook-basal body complex protein [Candidimonas sp.]
MGFGQGLSGLNAASQTLDVIGNNIANSGTVGFKSSTATFADVYASSRVGLGVQVASINQRFTIGTISGTGNQFDMAIDGAKGMFRVEDQSGNVLYTRNGQFFANKDNYIVNAQGQRLTGYVGAATTPTPIMVPVGNIAPQATTGITTKANFDANKPLAGNAVAEVIGQVSMTTGGVTTSSYYTLVGGVFAWTDSTGAPAPAPADAVYTTGDPVQTVTVAGGIPSVGGLPASGANTFADGPANTAYVTPVAPIAFNPAVAASFTHSLNMDVYDSLGNAHQFTQYFAKREAVPGVNESVWDAYYLLDGNPVTTPASQQLRFGDGGRLLAPTAPVAITVANVGGAASPAADLALSVDYGNSTQFGGPFSPNFTQTGYATGEYTSMSIAADGSIVASYTNGEVKSVGTLVLADFNNLQGLQPSGGNAWRETSASGQPILGTPGTNSLASIKGQAVEESNVDMSQELVNMIIAQRTYQANAQTIKTQDQVLQTLINLR